MGIRVIYFAKNGVFIPNYSFQLSNYSLSFPFSASLTVKKFLAYSSQLTIFIFSQPNPNFYL